MTLSVGEGLRGNSAACSALCQFSVTSPTSHKQIGPSGADFLGGWVCVCSRALWISPTSSPMRLGVSPAAASTPTGVFNQRFEALFPRTGALGCAVCSAPSPFLPVYPCMNVGRRVCQGLPTTLWGLLAAAQPALFHNPPPHWVCQPPPCHESSPPWLLVSAPPTCLDECFLFISLVVGLPYSSVFCQFWLFFVFKLLSFFWLCEEAQCVYLCLHISWNPDSFFF